MKEWKGGFYMGKLALVRIDNRLIHGQVASGCYADF